MKIEYIIIHHTGGTDSNPLADTSSHTASMIDFYHKSKGWDGIGYNWFIEKDGRIVKGRDETKVGAHTKGYNDKSIGVCLAGNFDLTTPTKEQTESLKKLLNEKILQYNIPIQNPLPTKSRVG